MSAKKQYDTDLPDTSKWLPREDAQENIAGAFLKRCQGIEQKILLLSQLERKMNIDNYDSGPGVEDIIREELKGLCPSRYSIHAGVIDDSKGRTAGDFEIIIANDIWFTPIKSGATKTSRRFHFPIEAVYGVIEVKQTLTYKELDKAMKKLVTCHRLYRPPTRNNRVTENRTQFLNVLETNSVRNTLYSAIIATGLGPGISKENIIRRFFEISKKLKPEELVRSLCILDQCTIGWRFPEPGNSNRMQHFVHELGENLMPISYELEEVQSALYPFVCELFSHLFNSVLGPQGYYEDYGFEDLKVRVLELEDQ